MNLNIINLDIQEWNKTDWNDAYNQYCKCNQFGAMSKKEYYDFVHKNHQRLKDRDAPLSDELARRWSAGRRAAKAWLEESNKENPFLIVEEAKSLDEVEDMIKDIEWKLINKRY